MLAAAAYFENDSEEEHEIRTIADELYRRADWQWAQDGGATVTHGWTPESGFLPYRWQRYDEALLLYLLGLGSPTHSLTTESYAAWSSTYQWKTIYGHEYLYAGPLFTHQLSHIWIDFREIQDEYMRGRLSSSGRPVDTQPFREIQDEYMRGRGIDYFENSRPSCTSTTVGVTRTSLARATRRPTSAMYSSIGSRRRRSNSVYCRSRRE
jgi:hypothetical protein